jgi:hypothetical protein
MQFPRTLVEFQDQFPDETHCWAYLRRARWPHGFECPRCGGRGSHFLASRRLEQCRTCRYQSSVTAGTVFHGTRVSLRIWFLGAFFLARHKKGISALQFQKDTGLGSYQTAWTLLHKLRSGLSALPAPLQEGDIRADETYIGGDRKGWNGREVGKVGVGPMWARCFAMRLITWSVATSSPAARPFRVFTQSFTTRILLAVSRSLQAEPGSPRRRQSPGPPGWMD